MNNLKDKLTQFELNNKSQLNDYMELEKKYNDLLKAFEIKEKEHSNEINQLSQLNKKNNNELELLKSKYEKKIQLLTLSNNELNERVKNLINSLIALKDYAMSIERNMNDANLNINNSIYTSLGLNYLGLNHCCNKNIIDKDKYNNDLINGMKDMISKIDSKIAINTNNNQFDYNN